MRGTHVAASDDPVLEDNVFGVPTVEAVGVHGVVPRVGGRVHVEIGHGHVLRVRDKGMPASVSVPFSYISAGPNRPELSLPPRYTVDEHILRFPKRQGYRTPGHVTSVLVHVIPLLSVAKEKSLTMAANGESVATESPSSGALGISNADAVTRPVVNVVVPRELSSDGDIAVLQIFPVLLRVSRISFIVDLQRTMTLAIV